MSDSNSFVCPQCGNHPKAKASDLGSIYKNFIGCRNCHQLWYCDNGVYALPTDEQLDEFDRITMASPSGRLAMDIVVDVLQKKGLGGLTQFAENLDKLVDAFEAADAVSTSKPTKAVQQAWDMGLTPGAGRNLT